MRVESEWRALSGQIDRIRDAADFIFTADRSIGAQGSERALGVLWLPAVNGAANQLLEFSQKHRSMLSPQGQRACEEYRQLYSLNFPCAGGDLLQTFQFAVSHLLAIQAALDFHLSDFDLASRRLVERAFLHLQRSLVVSARVRLEWQRAFRCKGETACEGLGATHLLLHGVWAFKVSGTGERTDLVLGEPARLDEIRRAADALVLTEWKAVKAPADANAMATQARTQAQLYAQGVLTGIELERTKFIVLVSEARLPPVADVVVGDVTYRHINVAVAPAVPSKERAPLQAGPVG